MVKPQSSRIELTGTESDLSLVDRSLGWAMDLTTWRHPFPYEPDEKRNEPERDQKADEKAPHAIPLA